jgi:hypothetical protein
MTALLAILSSSTAFMNLLAVSLSLMTTVRVEQQEDGPRRRRRIRATCNSLMCAPGGRGPERPEASGLNDHATFGERGDTSVRRTGLGANLLTVARARAWYLLL